MKRFVTKYALTTGIQEVEASYCTSDMIRFGNGVYTAYISRSDHFGTLAEAKAKAEEMRTNKVAGLKKQIARLEKLKF